MLERADFTAVDARDSNLAGSDLGDAELTYVNFRHARLRDVNFRNADLSNADLNSADLSGSDLSGVTLDGADLRFVNLSAVRWKRIKSIHGTNVFGVKNAPPEFLPWAKQNGAIESERDDATP